MKPKNRHEKGSMLVLIVCIVAFIIIPALILLCRLGPFLSSSGRAQNVVEAAGLLAANDLSRIVIDDPNFGYVSLSNHPSIGKATLALDGEPLPVTGINTLTSTIRQNAIIADELQNETMNALVDKDLSALAATIRNLNSRFNDLMSDTRTLRCFDMDGKAVNPVEDVKTFLAENLPNSMRLESVKLSTGWLQDGAETTIAVPQPVRLAQVHGTDRQSGQYEAFTNIPVGKRSFTFAGLGSQSHLVSNRKFQEADGKHICSIIKIECTITLKDQPDSKIQNVVCSQPYSQPASATRGAMTVRFAGRPVPGLLSWSEFLANGNFRDNKVTTFDIVGGDYPLEKKARMQQTHAKTQSATSQQFAEHLYFWLRNGRSRPRLDAILAMINEPFLSSPNEVYTYEFSENGSINRRVMDLSRFTRSVTADGQFAAMADTRTKSGASAIIFFRDNVKHLGILSSKHAGQPLAGYPLANLDGWIDQEQLALNFCKRSTQSGGLALDIEIGGTAESTARNDVLSMRQRTLSRRI